MARIEVKEATTHINKEEAIELFKAIEAYIHTNKNHTHLLPLYRNLQKVFSFQGLKELNDLTGS